MPLTTVKLFLSLPALLQPSTAFFLVFCSPFHKLCIFSSLSLVWGHKGGHDELSASCCPHLQVQCDDDDDDLSFLFTVRRVMLMFPSFFFLESVWSHFYTFSNTFYVMCFLSQQYSMILLLNAYSLSLLLSLKTLLLWYFYFSLA